MGQRVTLSGHIQELFYGVPAFEQKQRVEARNWAAIQRLPEEDRWPFLTRGMFSRSPEVQADGPLVTTYRGRVLFFGGRSAACTTTSTSGWRSSKRSCANSPGSMQASRSSRSGLASITTTGNPALART